MKKRIKPILAVIMLLIVLMCIGFLTRLIRKYTPSSEVMGPMEYYLLEDDTHAAVIVDDEVLAYRGMVIDDYCYVDVNAARIYLNDALYWDAEGNALIYTTPTEIINIPAEAKSYSKDGETYECEYAIAKAEGREAYVALDFVKQYSGISYEMFHDPDRIVITNQTGKVTLANIRKKGKLRYLGGIKSPILREMQKNEVVRVVEDLVDWTGVMTQDGYYGYIRSDRLVQIHEETLTSTYEPPVYSDLCKGYMINLVWHQITDMESNYGVIYDVAAVKGVNVISPTWFSIADNDGNLASWALEDYVETAHKADMDVWALVDNFSHDINFEKVMNTTSIRNRIENQLIASAIEYGLDGINVDFENISEDAAVGFIQFMREMSVKCRSNHLVLSVDVPPPTFTPYYNRKVLGTVSDYVIIMGYDEHYYGCETAGSVASLPYEEAGIADTLEEVESRKIISGIPFYTRLWETRVNADGSSVVTSEAMGMNDAQDILTNNEVKAEWDDATSQNYAAFYGTEGELYEIWMEDLDSLTEKLELLKKYELGGVAEWKLGLEDDSVWDLILKYIK